MNSATPVGEVAHKVWALMSFKAFRPETKNHVHPLWERVAGQRLALLNIGPGGAYVGSAVKHDKRMVVEESVFLPTTTVTKELVAALSQRTDCHSVAVLLTAASTLCDCQVITEDRDDVLVQDLVGDPQRIIGRSFERDRTYQVLKHPGHELGLVFSAATAEVSKVEKALEDHGLQVLRTQLGAFSLLNFLLADTSLGEPLPDKIVVPVAVEQTYATAVNVYRGNWGPRELLAHRQIVPNARAQDAFEQREVCQSFFEEMANHVRNHLMRPLDYPVEFVVLESSTKNRAFPLIKEFTEGLANISLSAYVSGRLPPTDLGFTVLTHN